MTEPFSIAVALLALCILIYCLCERYLMIGLFRQIIGTSIQGMVVFCGGLSFAYALIFLIMGSST